MVEQKSKFEVLSNAQKMVTEMMKKQEDKINALVTDDRRDDAVETLKLMHLVKMLITMGQ
jgi:hypothetical protein